MADNVLSVSTNAELLSYIINVTPELQAEIDLPVQGQSTKPIGQLIVDNARYRNAFINTINLIGLTIIKRNYWENPWEVFANRGTLRRGQQIREMIIDLAKVYDYNKNYTNKTKFLETEVPDVFNYIHELNFQKWYTTTLNETALQLAFDNEDDGLLTFITEQTATLYESWKYDKYLIDKYQLCRRILDGTITAKQIVNYSSKNPRDILAEIKGISNKMIFRSPNYNPAGVRRATPFAEQYLMLDAEREAINTTNVLATSYFLNEAQVKTNFALIDSFTDTDETRLAEVLEEAYIPFTEEEKEKLANVVGLIISDKFFMDYAYAIDNERRKLTEFENPTTLDKNLFLHIWEVFSTSPFENCCVFTTDNISVTSVTVSPATATVTKGQKLQMSATVETTGFANKAVIWSAGDEDGNTIEGVTIAQSGELTVANSVASDTEITVKATSVYDNTKTGIATITVA